MCLQCNISEKMTNLNIFYASCNFDLSQREPEGRSDHEIHAQTMQNAEHSKQIGTYCIAYEITRR